MRRPVRSRSVRLSSPRFGARRTAGAVALRFATVAGALGLALALALAFVGDGRFGRAVDRLDARAHAASGERTFTLSGPDAALLEPFAAATSAWAAYGFERVERAPLDVVVTDMVTARASGLLAELGLAVAEDGSFQLLAAGAGAEPEPIGPLEMDAAVVSVRRIGEQTRIDVLPAIAERATGRLDELAAEAPPLVPGLQLRYASGVRLVVPRAADGELRPARARLVLPSVLAPAAQADAPTRRGVPRGGLGVRYGGDIEGARRAYGTRASADAFARMRASGVDFVVIDARISLLRPGDGEAELTALDLDVDPASITLEGDRALASAIGQARAAGLHALLRPVLVASASGPSQARALWPTADGRDLDLFRSFARFAADADADGIVALGPREFPQPLPPAAQQKRGQPELFRARAAWRAALGEALADLGLPAVAVARRPELLRFGLEGEDALTAPYGLGTELEFPPGAGDANAPKLVGLARGRLRLSANALGARGALIEFRFDGDGVALGALADAWRAESAAPALVLGLWQASAGGGTPDLARLGPEAWARFVRGE